MAEPGKAQALAAAVNQCKVGLDQGSRSTGRCTFALAGQGLLDTPPENGSRAMWQMFGV